MRSRNVCVLQAINKRPGGYQHEDYASWGIYISNFVFFVAISLVGSLITAILRLATFTEHTTYRIAEIIAVSAIVFASLIIIVDMEDRKILPPVSLCTFTITHYVGCNCNRHLFFISLLLLYFPLLPDLKIMLNNKNRSSKSLNKLYHFLGSFWKGTATQTNISNKAINILCITIYLLLFVFTQ
jgi:molybdopterin-containing oxidoreductase family membrane subunit